MRKPYLKKVGVFSGVKVWKVNGKYVRENLNEEFTNFAQHATFGFIPKNEFWIDKESSENETKYFITHMLAEAKFLKHGKTKDEAFALADKIEQAERRKAKTIKKYLKNKTHKKEIISKIHKKLLKKYSNDKIKVWIIKGNLVRDLFFIDFTEGGHDYVYRFVPKNEIWIDDDVRKSELKLVLLHEVHERNLMAKGWPYWEDKNHRRSAHWSASKIEYYCRKHKKMLDKNLKKEFAKIKD